jgi:D-alanyl-D-alanine carboxypeptidase (penicillin-binding protein 5/6)
MRRLLASVSLALASLATLAQTPQPPEIAAQSYVLIDVTTGQTLAERAADAPADPASLTKLMTAYLAFNAIKEKKLALDQSLSVSTRAWAERKGGGSLMFIDTTMHPTVDELLKGVIVQSGNDASVALAEGVAGSLDAFVAMMNRQAKDWGLKNTTFKNVTGLTEPGHQSTARDIATIAAHIIKDHPDFYTYYSIRQYTYNHVKQDNRNMLLGRDPTVDGMKTGYTGAAGYCLVASAQREFPNLGAAGTPAAKRRLLSVVMGTASREARASESQKLLNWGYFAFDPIRLFEAGKPVSTVQVWKGSQREAKLGAPGAVVVDVPRGEGAKLQTKIERTDPLVAPLVQGQRVGTIKVATAAGAPVADVPLIVQEGVPQAGPVGRAWDAIRLWIR